MPVTRSFPARGNRCLARRDGELVYDGPPDASVIAGHLPQRDDAPLALEGP
ncbi:MAG TPA: hypothetical protein VG365_02440 [Solirubrobacteraceae bacterium]|nr:hypothetical protein [Solirubrobacteraceae bacterium]